jgi:threonine dehydratase
MNTTATKTYTPPNIEDVRAAHRRIAPYIHRTPVMTSASLNEMAGAKLFFKCENLQKGGAFKMRGATNAIFMLSDAEAAPGVVTHSSGNHAQAVALAAKLRGIRAWVVMPRNAPEVKQRAVKAYGAEVTLCEPTVKSREETAAEIMRRTGAVLIHPFDDDRIIAGQATAALELLEEVPDLDVIIAPVSGGGLLSGTSISAKAMRPEIRVIGCEPQRADDAYRSLTTGQLQRLEQSDTIADGLRASLAPRTFEIIRRNVDRIALVTEEEIIAAMRNVWERMKIIIEPSSAVAVAPALLRRMEADGKKVGIILSGGNMDLAHLPFA